VKWSEQHWARLMDRYTPEAVDGKARDVSYWFQLGKKRAEWWVLGGEAIVAEGIADAIFTGPGVPVGYECTLEGKRVYPPTEQS